MGREYPQQPVPAVAAVVLRREENISEVLLVRRANPPSEGEWSLPGGVLELGETLREGLIREVREETGIEVEPIALLEVLDHIFHDGVTKGHVDGRVRFHYVLIDFVCGVRGGMLAGASDALEARWVERSQLEGRDIEGQAGFALPVRTREVIQKAFRLLDEGLALI